MSQRSRRELDRSNIDTSHRDRYVTMIYDQVDIGSERFRIDSSADYKLLNRYLSARTQTRMTNFIRHYEFNPPSMIDKDELVTVLEDYRRILQVILMLASDKNNEVLVNLRGSEEIEINHDASSEAYFYRYELTIPLVSGSITNYLKQLEYSRDSSETDISFDDSKGSVVLGCTIYDSSYRLAAKLISQELLSMLLSNIRITYKDGQCTIDISDYLALLAYVLSNVVGTAEISYCHVCGDPMIKMGGRSRLKEYCSEACRRELVSARKYEELIDEGTDKITASRIAGISIDKAETIMYDRREHL